MKENSYVRLPGRFQAGYGLFTTEREKLFLSEDTLLQVKKRGYTIRYKRFALKDVQAFIISPTWGRRYLCALLFLLLLFFLIPLFFIPAFYVTGIPASVLILLIIGIVVALGPTCSCTVVTAAQQERLSSLSRLKTARRVVRDLEARIQAVQSASEEAGKAEEEAPKFKVAD